MCSLELTIQHSMQRLSLVGKKAQLFNRRQNRRENVLIGELFPPSPIRLEECRAAVSAQLILMNWQKKVKLMWISTYSNGVGSIL